MPDLAYINHIERIVELKDAAIPILDRGFLFADSVYEVIRIYQGTPFCLREHLQRLNRNVKELQINFHQLDTIPQILIESIHQSEYQDAKVYIQITRGVASRKLSFPADAKPTFIITVEALDIKQIATWQKNGVKLISIQDTRWSRCDIKTTMLLPNVLAAQEAKFHGAYDALFVDQKNVVRETTHASFFIILNGNLVVPPVDDHLLPGITRNIVLRLADRMNVPISIRHPTLQETLMAEEAFVTATTTEIIPVIQIDEKVLSNHKPGRITSQLQNAYHQYIKEWLSKFVET